MGHNPLSLLNSLVLGRTDRVNRKFIGFVNDWYSVERIRSIKYILVKEFSNIPNEYSLNSLTELMNSLTNSKSVRSALFWYKKNKCDLLHSFNC